MPASSRAHGRVSALAITAALSLLLAACGGGDKEPVAGDSDTGSKSAQAFGEVSVTGPDLTEYSSDGADATVGSVAPTLTMEGPTGDKGVIGGAAQPTLVVFLAHWCPHCQAEVPVIVKAFKDGRVPDIRLVAVATSTNPQAQNYPPDSWLDREDWPGEILLDDKDFTAGRAFGLASFPYLVALDAAGKVTGRALGDTTVSQIEALAATAV